MASPANPSHPLTPPAEPSSTQPTVPQPSQSQPTTASQLDAMLSQPATSLTDDGKSRRPRDHRLIHLLLASHGVAAYQERVPLQLMDFAYRYTSSILGDALHIQNEGYDVADSATGPAATQPKGRGAGASKVQRQGNAGAEEGEINLSSLRLAIGSRMSYQFQQNNIPKEFLKCLAEERNRIGLNVGQKEGEKSAGPIIGGVKLPHERYCLTGVGWGLKEAWDSEGEESAEEDGATGDDQTMQLDGHDEMDEDEDGMGTMEDVFGADDDGEGDGADERMDDT